ncbi:lanthionine synthetase LanC family protein [Streptomyces sp. NPDC058953]|uniref:lanthionine synthetase LanC family protein n=1 Tax=unclassified Streptomyces TaxID=2593676 RepID=UPI0036C3FC74
MPTSPRDTSTPLDSPQALDRAVRLLAGYRADDTGVCDPGVPVLAALVAATGTGLAVAAAHRATAEWARTVGRGPSHHALYDGGLAGSLVGAYHAARLHPQLHRIADRLREHLLTEADRRPWRTEDVALTDYDLISGPAGTLLALYAGSPEPPGRAAPAARHLAALCDEAELPRLRTGPYADDPNLSWLHGRINTGMGHGVAGLVTALTAAVRVTGPEPALTRALGHAVPWLVRQSFDDALSVRSWDGAGLDAPPAPGVRARQAWCYGNPGVTWAVWDAADAVGDRETASWATEAFTGLADRYDENLHLFGDEPADRLGLCHGAAGVLVVADAFARHARLSAAATLRARLLRHLEARLPELDETERWHDGLLGGTTGVVAALLTCGHGGSRAWLPCLGLR